MCAFPDRVLPLTTAQVHGFSEVAADPSQKAVVTTINYEARDFDSYNFSSGRVDLIFAMKVRALLCPVLTSANRSRLADKCGGARSSGPSLSCATAWAYTSVCTSARAGSR